MEMFNRNSFFGRLTRKPSEQSQALLPEQKAPEWLIDITSNKNKSICKLEEIKLKLEKLSKHRNSAITVYSSKEKYCALFTDTFLTACIGGWSYLGVFLVSTAIDKDSSYQQLLSQYCNKPIYNNQTCDYLVNTDAEFNNATNGYGPLRNFCSAIIDNTTHAYLQTCKEWAPCNDDAISFIIGSTAFCLLSGIVLKKSLSHIRLRYAEIRSAMNTDDIEFLRANDIEVIHNSNAENIIEKIDKHIKSLTLKRELKPYLPPELVSIVKEYIEDTEEKENKVEFSDNRDGLHFSSNTVSAHRLAM
jgi:hypothetical protein